MNDNERYREAARRRHKLLGAYLVFWAWARKVDCVALPKGQLRPHLGLDRIDGERIEWLREDLKKLFPYSWPVEGVEVGEYETLYLSRSEIPPGGALLDDQEHIEWLKTKDLKAGIVKLPSESKIVRIMALLIHGISDLPDEGETK